MDDEYECEDLETILCAYEYGDIDHMELQSHLDRLGVAHLYTDIVLKNVLNKESYDE